MSDPNLSNTQPSHIKASNTLPTIASAKSGGPGKNKRARRWAWILLIVFLFGLSLILGALAGYQSAKSTQNKQADAQNILSLDEQFQLGLTDLADGRFEVAAQRFEYILSIDPSYPGVPEKLAEAVTVLYITATPTTLPATITPTPTIDPRPVEELFTQALAQTAAQDWEKSIEVLLALRQADSAFQAARVDGLLYLALRNRGVIKILQNGNLEGGIYDLALANAFGPIDGEANQARDWARFYMIGLSFWEVYPEQAVYYFAQVAAAAPYLSDASGWTATDRYRAVLIQYGDFFAGQQSWCQAQTQYELAMNIRSDAALQQAWQTAGEQCLQTTITPTLPESPTPTLTGTPAPGASPTATSTQGTGPTSTATQAGVTSTATQPLVTATVPSSGATPTPTATSTQIAPPLTNTPYPAPLFSNSEQDASARMAADNAKSPLYILWGDLLKLLLEYTGWDDAQAISAAIRQSNTCL